jgi:hypothetical protein
MIRESGLKPDADALGAWWSTIDEWRKRDCMKYSLEPAMSQTAVCGQKRSGT